MLSPSARYANMCLPARAELLVSPGAGSRFVAPPRGPGIISVDMSRLAGSAGTCTEFFGPRTEASVCLPVPSLRRQQLQVTLSRLDCIPRAAARPVNLGSPKVIKSFEAQYVPTLGRRRRRRRRRSRRLAGWRSSCCLALNDITYSYSGRQPQAAIKGPH